MPVMRIFVYGTLKREGRYHDEYCRGYLTMEEASLEGRLYVRASGIPLLEIPENAVLAWGSVDPLVDAVLQSRWEAELPLSANPPSEASCSTPGWIIVHGEIFTFDDPPYRLPPLDRFEGYRPGSPSVYRRVLAPVRTPSGLMRPCWLYTTYPGGMRGRLLSSGRWHPPFRGP